MANLETCNAHFVTTFCGQIYSFPTGKYTNVEPSCLQREVEQSKNHFTMPTAICIGEL